MGKARAESGMRRLPGSHDLSPDSHTQRRNAGVGRKPRRFFCPGPPPTTTYRGPVRGLVRGPVRGPGTWGTWGWYVGLVRGAGTWGCTWGWYVGPWYVGLVRGAGTWGWYVGLVRGAVRGAGTWGWYVRGWYVGPTYRRWEGGGRWSHVPKEGARMWWGSVTYHHLPPPTTSGSALPVDSG